MTDHTEQIAKLKAGIEALESQRSILGDLVVDSGIKGMRDLLAELEQEPLPQGRSSKESSTVPQTEGERRQATILFSDLSGYTAMSEKLDPEDVEAIMTKIKEAAIQIVESHEGTVNQFIGDEVVALFGIPIAHEDDPSRAVKSAMELHAMVREMSGEVEPLIGQPLTMHSGINTGLIVTAMRDERDGKFGLTGDSVNIGARLLAQAKENEILVSPAIKRLITPYFRTEPLEPVQLKGKTLPMVPHRILGKTGIQTRIEAAEQQGFTAYTGRDEELATLNTCLGKTIQGEGQFVTVQGEAGLGKSRLLYEFRHNLDRKNITVVQGHCQSYGVYTPYLPFLDALRRGLHLGDEDSPAELHEKAVSNILKVDPALEKYLPVFLHLLSIPTDQYPLPKELSGEKLKQTIQEASVAINILNTQHQPMVFILEDWHWADEASDATLIKHLEMMSSYPLMIVVLYRPEYSPKWGQLPFHTPIDLTSVNGKSVESMIKTIYGVEHLPKGFASQIFQHSGGNPFFIEELCDLFKEGETVLIEGREVHLQQPIEQITFPETVQAVIRTRLDRLTLESKEVLRLASVIGREFLKRILEQIIAKKAGGRPETVPPSLEHLKQMDLIRQIEHPGGASSSDAPLPEMTYQFNHVITQEVTYQTLLLKQRVSLHRLVAEAIEVLYADRLEEQVEVLAYHYRNSNHVEKTTQYLELAGDKSAGFFDLGDARGFYQEAIELIDQSELTNLKKEKRIDLNLKLASISGYTPSEWHLKCLKISLGYAEQLDDLLRKAKILYWLGRMFYSLGNYTQAQLQLENCIEMNEILHEGELSAMAYNMIGRMCWFNGDYQKGIAHLEKWIPRLERFNSPTDVNYSMGFLGGMYGMIGDFKQSTEILEKTIKQTIDLKDTNREAATRCYQSAILAIRGNWKNSIELCDRAIQLLVSEISNHLIEAICGWTKGYCLCMLEEIEKGVDLMQEAMRFFDSTGSKVTTSYWYAWYAEIMSKVGRFWEAEEFANKSLELDRFGERWGSSVAYRALASIALQTNDFPKASSALSQSIQIAIDRGAKPELAVARYYNTQLFMKQEDLPQAREQLTQAIELFTEMEMTWWLEQARELEERLVKDQV